MNKVLLIPYLKAESEIRFLVGRRPKNLVPDYLNTTDLWQFPTGKVGDNILGETVIEGALRELGEELGVNRFRNFINNGYNFHFKPNSGKDIDRGDFHEYVFAVELPNKKIKLEKKEFEEYLLLNKGDASKKLFFDSHKEFLEKIFRDIQGSNFAKIFVISGPGGSGKETVLELITKKTNLKRAQTVTTRKKELGENETGRTFISERKFKEMEENGEFIETNYFKGNYYGSPKSGIESELINGRSVLIELDLNGLEAIRRKYSCVVSVFITVDLETLERRMVLRGRDSKEEIARRLEISKKELKRSKICDYIITNNDGMLDNTVKQLQKIIIKEKGVQDDTIKGK